MLIFEQCVVTDVRTYCFSTERARVLVSFELVGTFYTSTHMTCNDKIHKENSTITFKFETTRKCWKKEFVIQTTWNYDSFSRTFNANDTKIFVIWINRFRLRVWLCHFFTFHFWMFWVVEYEDHFQRWLKNFIDEFKKHSHSSFSIT